VAVHDLDLEAIRAGEKGMDEVREDLKGIAGKARAQILKDYIAWPVISGAVMTLIEVAIFSAKERADQDSRKPTVQAKRVGRKLRRRRESFGTNVLRQLIERRSFREPFKRTLTANVVANLIRNVWS
jgi:NADPH-dependent stearoyl-CoA 9-desaturase